MERYNDLQQILLHGTVLILSLFNALNYIDYGQSSQSYSHLFGRRCPFLLIIPTTDVELLFIYPDSQPLILGDVVEFS